MCCAFHRRGPLLAVCISLLCGQLVVAQVGPAVTDDIAVLGERLEAAQNPGEMEAFFEATMLSLDGATISKLTSDKNDTLALRASWHSIIGRPPFKEIERIGDSVRAHRFL